MKANKFPGNVMKTFGMKSWCQTGIVTSGIVLVGIMIIHGYTLPWHGSMGAEGWVEHLWDGISAVLAILSVGVGFVAGGIGTVYGIKHGWAFARDKCEQINYEED